MSAFEAFRRGIVVPWSLREKVLGVLLAVAIPTLLRWLADSTVIQSPFIAHFPAILLAAVFIGWRWAALTAFLSLIAVRLLFMPPGYESGPGAPTMALIFLLASALVVLVLVGHLLREAIIQLDAHARQSDAFNQELQHRTKNTLQILRALLSQRSRAADLGEFYDGLAGRLEAFVAANELLRFGAAASCNAAELVEAALRPFPAEQITVWGPDCELSRDAANPLMMALHELGTNATKYGALSCLDGRVTLRWALNGELIDMIWEESGGPEVSPPSRAGLGSRLLTANGSLKAVEVDYRPTGVVCRMSATAHLTQIEHTIRRSPQPPGTPDRGGRSAKRVCHSRTARRVQGHDEIGAQRL